MMRASAGPKANSPAMPSATYSDEKPHWSFWVVIGTMTVVVVLAVLGVI